MPQKDDNVVYEDGFTSMLSIAQMLKIFFLCLLQTQNIHFQTAVLPEVVDSSTNRSDEIHKPRNACRWYFHICYANESSGQCK